MQKIYTECKTIFSKDPIQFNKELSKVIEQFQVNNFYVEIQYAVSEYMLSALVLKYWIERE